MSTKLQFSTPDLAALQRNIEDAERATEKLAAEREQRQSESFGKRIAQSVRARQRPRFAHVIASEAGSPAAEPQETFAERLKKAVDKKSGQKQHEKFVERERQRLDQQRKQAAGE